MGKAEIIKELSHLSVEELAEVRARIDQLAQQNPPTNGNGAKVRGIVRMRSPRLANRSQSRDFIKQVTEAAKDA